MANIHLISPSAIHEAGHVVMAQAFGVKGIRVRRNARRGRPGMDAFLSGLETTELVFILLAGMAAERRTAREHGKPLSLSDLRVVGRGDLAFLRLLGIHITDLERALDLVEEELSTRWQHVLRTAVAIQKAWDKGGDWVDT